MKIEFSTVQRPRCNRVLMPFCVYHVDADDSYRTKKGVSRSRRGLVAIRTIGGMGRLSIAGEKYFDLPEGSLLIVPAWKLERYAPANDAWNFWWFEYENGEGYIPEEQLFYLQATQLEELLSKQTLEAMRGFGDEGAEAASAYFSALMSIWYESVKKQLKPAEESCVDHVIREIRTFPEKDYSIQRLAADCFLSERQFRNLFFARAGMSPKAFIIRCRMERACTMLFTTTLPINQVAEACGYSDPLYFSKQFLKYNNTSPSEFRQQGGGDIG